MASPRACGRPDGDSQFSLLQLRLPVEFGQAARRRPASNCNLRPGDRRNQFRSACATSLPRIGHGWSVPVRERAGRRLDSCAAPAPLALRTAASACGARSPGSAVPRARPVDRRKRGLGGTSRAFAGNRRQFVASSSTMRLTVFLPTPGIRTSWLTSPRRMKLMKIRPASPDRSSPPASADAAHPDDFSNSAFSSWVRKP